MNESIPALPIATPPDDLGPAGSSLWQSVHASRQPGHDFTETDVELLTLACRQADDVTLLEEVLATDGPMVMGSRGQKRISPVLAEIRNSRLSIARLVGQVDTGSEPTKAEKARASAVSRWGRSGAPKVTPLRADRQLPAAK